MGGRDRSEAEAVWRVGCSRAGAWGIRDLSLYPMERTEAFKLDNTKYRVVWGSPLLQLWTQLKDWEVLR